MNTLALATTSTTGHVNNAGQLITQMGDVLEFEVLDKPNWQKRLDAYRAQPMHGLSQNQLKRNLNEFLYDPDLPAHYRSMAEDMQAMLVHVWSVHHEISLMRLGAGDKKTLDWLAGALDADACALTKPSHEVAGRFGWKAVEPATRY